MKIAVLNKCFLRDSHMHRLRKLGELSMYDDTTTETQAIERTKNTDIAIVDCFFTPLNKIFFDSATRLKYISINTTGFEPVDIDAARKKGVKISNLPGYSTEAVAEYTIALIFAVVRKITLGDRNMRSTPFEINPGNTNHDVYKGYQLKDKTIGLIGLGNIGLRVAQIATSLNMKIIAFNRTPKEIIGVIQKPFEEVLRESDIVSLHIPYTPEYENIISEKEFGLMKKGAVLINTARGKLVNTQALYQALKLGRLSGAGLDVIAEWDKNNPLLALDNVVLTPHMAYYTEESISNMANMIIQNVEAYVNGSPINLITG